MKPIPCLERGTNEIEVTEAILNGSHKQGKQGRLELRKSYNY